MKYLACSITLITIALTLTSQPARAAAPDVEEIVNRANLPPIMAAKTAGPR
jgi:hypothetical protein